MVYNFLGRIDNIDLFVGCIFDILGKRYAFWGEHATYFYQMSKLLILLISITLFIGFLGLNIRYSRFINTIASATFRIP